jgi:hypothetical protein
VVTNDPAADDPRLRHWLDALEARHLANLTRSELTRALRALSSCYVERRQKLTAGAPLETAGKRAAFALYYGPLHFFTIAAVVRASGLDRPAPGTINDLGCGTGVGGAAWALACGEAPYVAGVDRSAWAVDEANWTYGQLGVRGRASRGDLASPRFRSARGGADTAILLAYAVNELPEAARAVLLDRVADAVGRGAALLVIEPIGTRLGNAGWWESWTARLGPLGVTSREWRFPAALPGLTRDLARAAGLEPRELTARTLSSAGASGPGVR